jgi:ribosomal protein S18 acetylase RimI-like enzyme
LENHTPLRWFSVASAGPSGYADGVMLTERELIQLADLNYLEAIRDQTRGCGGEIAERDGVLLMTGPGPHPIVNSAARTDPSADADACMAAISAHYSARNYGFSLVLLNGHEEEAMQAAATRVGMVPLLSPPEMILRKPLPAKALAAGVTMLPVDDEARLADFRTVAEDAWSTYGIPAAVTGSIFAGPKLLQLPHVRGVVAYDHGKPAACALVHLSHGIAGIYWVSTAASARRKGLAEACTREVSNQGFALGGRVVSLQASPMGFPIYQRMGFETIATYRLLVLFGAAS